MAPKIKKDPGELGSEKKTQKTLHQHAVASSGEVSSSKTVKKRELELVADSSTRRKLVPVRDNQTRQPRKQKKPRRFHKVASEIKRLQHTTDLLIRRASFARLVRQILVDRHPHGLDFRWQRAAIECLQEASEAYLVQFFGDVNVLAHHAKRVTVMPVDVYILKKIRGPDS